MMGSLLIVPGGGLALALPTGVPCGHGDEHGGDGNHDGGGTMHTVDMLNNAYAPQFMTIANGDSARFVNKDGFAHTVDWESPGSPPNSGTINAAGAAGDTYTTPVMTAA